MAQLEREKEGDLSSGWTPLDHLEEKRGAREGTGSSHQPRERLPGE